MIGDGTADPVVIAGDKLGDENELTNIASSLALPTSIQTTRASLAEKLFKWVAADDNNSTSDSKAKSFWLVKYRRGFYRDRHHFCGHSTRLWGKSWFCFSTLANGKPSPPPFCQMFPSKPGLVFLPFPFFFLRLIQEELLGQIDTFSIGRVLFLQVTQLAVYLHWRKLQLETVSICMLLNQQDGHGILILFHAKLQLDWCIRSPFVVEKLQLWSDLQLRGLMYPPSFPKPGQIWHVKVMVYCTMPCFILIGKYCLCLSCGMKTLNLTNFAITGGSCTYPLPDQCQIWHDRVDLWSALIYQVSSGLIYCVVLEGR